MDKNTIIGMLLMVAVVFGFMYLQQPSEEEIKAQQEAQKQEQVARATAALAHCGHARLAREDQQYRHQ